MSHRALGQQFSRFFHGSDAELTPGKDFLEPRSNEDYDDVWDGEVPSAVHVTDDPTIAQQYGDHVYEVRIPKDRVNMELEQTSDSTWMSDSPLDIHREVPKPVIDKYSRVFRES